MRVDIDTLLASTAGLIGKPSLGEQQAGALLAAILTSIARFDHMVAFAYREQEQPVHVYSTFDETGYDIYVSQYLVGPYLLDPFYRNAMVRNDGVWRMRELAPDRFFSSEYFRSYYAKTGLAEEIGFFTSLDNGITLVVSLMRREAAGPFTAAEFALLKKASVLVAAVCASFWSQASARFKQKQGIIAEPNHTDTVSQALRSSRQITSRETEIIQLVLQGHSSEAIGLQLGIRTGTVKVHRRNIYRKLAITSQTQLFTLFFPSSGPKSEPNL